MSRSRTQDLGQRSGEAIGHIFHDVAFHNVLEGNSCQRVDSGGDGAVHKRKCLLGDEAIIIIKRKRVTAFSKRQASFAHCATGTYE